MLEQVVLRSHLNFLLHGVLQKLSYVKFLQDVVVQQIQAPNFAPHAR